VVSDAVKRLVEQRASVIDDDVARLKFVRHSIAAHAAATRRRASFLRRSLAAHRSARRRCTLAVRLVLTTLLMAVAVVPVAPRATVPKRVLPARQLKLTGDPGVSKVWLVEHKSSIEVYSNGLRVEEEFLTNTRTRAFRPFDRQSWRPAGTQTQPAGIVFHTTESRMAPFDPSQNARLQRNGRNLLAYVAQHRFYHFLIDRFGRVFRVVAETDYANHAGQSIWADERFVYWGLNQSFLGVAFEAQTEREADQDIATRAQIDAARVLTEMLRSRYRIPASNCVTHAQVSINPQSMRLGYHTDWAANFPFREVGLGDGYETPVAALTLFGFDYDSAFLQANGRQVWPGLVLAEEHLLREAAAHGTTLSLYRRMLQQKFRTWKTAQATAGQEENAGDRL
jgi:hypothetical protein